MKSRMLLILTVGVFAVACDCDNEEGREIPGCMEKKIRQLELGPALDSAFSITMITTTTGEKYFYFPPPQCCDFFSELYDSQCNLVCNPDGGFSGQGQGVCPEYLVLKKEVIWKDKRSQ